jgi:hypothetical protein
MLFGGSSKNTSKSFSCMDLCWHVPVFWFANIITDWLSVSISFFFGQVLFDMGCFFREDYRYFAVV